MSNISTILQFLKGKPERFITITNQDNGKLIGKDAVYLTDIPNEDLQHYIKYSLGTISVPTLVWIELRTKQGVTSRKENVAKVEIMPDNYIEPTQVVNNLPVAQPQPQQAEFLAAPSLGNNVFGLGFPEIMAMQRKSDQLEEKREQYTELKEEYKELKHSYNVLELDHRGVLSKLAIAESQKEMAVMLAKAENKSFADSPAFQSLLERAPEVLAGIAAMKSGGAAPIAMGLGTPGASESHTQFIEYANENLNENQINFLGTICGKMTNPVFEKDLISLIQKYATV